MAALVAIKLEIAGQRGFEFPAVGVLLSIDLLVFTAAR
jgi:hypothetical protein